MTLATALVSGNDPQPRLAEEAVHRALAKAGLSHANGLLLFLSPEFAKRVQDRQLTQATVTAAARAAQSTQVAGGIAAGLCTEEGWVVDRPAAAVMVFGNGLSLAHPKGDEATLSYAGETLPPSWSGDTYRFGGSYGGHSFHSGHSGLSEASIWQQARLTKPPQCSVQICGARTDVAASSGLRLLGDALRVDRCNGFDVERLGGQAAVRSLERLLPSELRPLDTRHVHHLNAILIDDGQQHDATHALSSGRYRAVALIAANADGSVTLTEQLVPGQHLAWVIRQPLSAEAEMRQTVTGLAGFSASKRTNPAGALMFSCIGRGPFFYGGEDRDLDVLRGRFPGLPILGVYGSGQLAPAANTPNGDDTLIRNRQLQNAVVTALIHKHPN